MDVLLYIGLFVVSLTVLLRASDWFVDSAEEIGLSLGISPFIIGLTIVALFLGETAELPILRIATISFLSGVSCFLLALLCFLTETVLATRLLKFRRAARR